MKKLSALLLCVMGLTWGMWTLAQDFSVTNSYSFTNTVKAVQTITLGSGMVPVVSSAGSPLTNSSQWATWIPRYISNNIYFNPTVPTNSDVKVLWGEPKAQARGIYQGNAPVWNGTNYVRWPLASERILAGERLHVLIGWNESATTLTNLVATSNVVYNTAGLIYKVIDIPKTKPPGY